MDALVGRLEAFATDLARGGAGLLARARHRKAFATALEALDAATAEPPPPVEILAEHLRAARFALERLIGAVDVEDILGDVFSPLLHRQGRRLASRRRRAADAFEGLTSIVALRRRISQGGRQAKRRSCQSNVVARLAWFKSIVNFH